MGGDTARVALCFGNPLDRELLCRFVADLGHEPVTGREEAAACDLVFLDTAAARGLTGQVADWKRRAQGFLPVLVGIEAGAAPGPWLAAGFDDVVRLPCAKQELEARIGLLLRLRHQSQELGRRSEYLHRALVESSGDHIFVLDADGRYVSSNDRVAHLGLTRGEELVGRNLEEVFPPGVAALYRDRLAAVLATGETVIFEHDLPTGQAARFHLDTLYPLRSAGGEPLVGGICRDITDRKRAEQALRASEEKFSRAFQASPNLMSITRLSDGRVLEASQSFLDAIERPREEVIGHTVAEFNLWVEPRRREEMVRRLRETGRVDAMEARINTRTGKIRTMLIAARPIAVDGADCVLIVGTDVTERVQAEQARRLLETAISHLAEGVFVCDRDNRILYANPAMGQITGYTPEELRGNTPGLFKSGRHEPAFYRKLKTTIYGGRPWRGYLTNRNKNGATYEVFATITPILDREGAVTHFVSVHRDVTKEREIEQRVRRNQRLEAIGTLAGGIAHDFNNILMPILGYTELCQAALPAGSKARSDLDQVLLAASRARDLAQQILSFSRQSKHERSPLQLGPVVKEALKLLRASLPATIEMRQQIGPVEETVVADPTEVHQVIMNLCTNASHAMPEGGTLSVSLQAVELDRDLAATLPGIEPGRFVRLTVADTGCGMAPEIVDRIFEPYFTTKEEGRGTGLGLAVVHGIVTACGGALTVYSEPGAGSTFHVYLPAAAAGPEPVAAEGPEVRRGHERILFVDDDPAIADLGRRALEKYGYRVTPVTEPARALALFREDPAAVDLVVTDMTMPGMTGEDLTLALLALRPDLPVVLCTGFSERMNADRALETGIKAFLGKPVRPAELAETVRRLLDERAGEGSA